MATVITNVQESIYQIKRWLGVNEAQEGEASLKMGEAAVMRNFKVTDGGALKKRAGSKNIAGLMSGYTVEVDTGTTSVLLTEAGSSSAALTMYTLRPTAWETSCSPANPRPSTMKIRTATSATTTETVPARSTNSPVSRPERGRL